MLVSNLYIFFGKMSIQVFGQFFNWIVRLIFFILNCVICLHILDFNSLLKVISLMTVFSHSIGCLFILPMFAFILKNLLDLIRSYFCFLYFSFSLFFFFLFFFFFFFSLPVYFRVKYKGLPCIDSDLRCSSAL